MWGSGMPSGFAELLRRKYNIMQQSADTERVGVDAAANLDMVKAGLMPAMQKQQILESQAGIGKTSAETAGILEGNKFIGRQAEADIGYKGALGFQARSNGMLDQANIPRVGAETETLRDAMRTGRFSFGGLLSDDQKPKPTNWGERTLRNGLFGRGLGM